VRVEFFDVGKIGGLCRKPGFAAAPCSLGSPALIAYLTRRVFALIPVALAVATLTFALIHLVPGDPVVAMLGESAAPADVEGMRHQLGLDRPLAAQYTGFLIGLARGDFGESISYRIPVTNLIVERLPATLELAAAGMLVAIALAVPLGMVAGTRPGSVYDIGAMGFAVLGISVPHLYLGPLLMIVFALDLGWLPLTGRGGLAHLVLPAITLGTAMAAILARMLRQSLVEVRNADFMRTARGKGLSNAAAMARHGLRNALTPVVTVLGLQAGALLTGSIITEMIFSWPGMGRLMIGAINARDYPLVQGCVLVFAFSYVLVNMLTDFVYGFIDPRIRLA
jgi:peptide/nickel transport system permease protein